MESKTIIDICIFVLIGILALGAITYSAYFVVKYILPEIKKLEKDKKPTFPDFN